MVVGVNDMELHRKYNKESSFKVQVITEILKVRLVGPLSGDITYYYLLSDTNVCCVAIPIPTEYGIKMYLFILIAVEKTYLPILIGQ